MKLNATIHIFNHYAPLGKIEPKIRELPKACWPTTYYTQGQSSKKDLIFHKGGNRDWHYRLCSKIQMVSYTCVARITNINAHVHTTHTNRENSTFQKKFEAIFSYIVCLRPAWTRRDLSQKWVGWRWGKEEWSSSKLFKGVWNQSVGEKPQGANRFNRHQGLC